MQARFLRENAFLVAAVALPLMVVGFFLLATAIPRWTVPPPAHDLLFTSNDYGAPRLNVSVEFTVADGRLRATVRPVPRDAHQPRPELWLFDHETMTVREIPIAVPELAEGDPPRTIAIEALAGRRVQTSPEAPDGYEVRSADRSSPGIAGELFGMRRYDRQLSIARGGRVVPIELPPRRDSWTAPGFIGWLVNGQER